MRKKNGGAYNLEVLEFNDCLYRRELDDVIVMMHCALPKDEEERSDALAFLNVLTKATLTGKAAEKYETIYNKPNKEKEAPPAGPTMETTDDDDDEKEKKVVHAQVKVPLCKILFYALDEPSTGCSNARVHCP